MRNSGNSILVLFFVLLCVSCGESGNNFFKPQRIDPPSVQDRASLLQEENLGRSSWQRPQLIVDKIGGVKGKTIADIGAGTGYFTFHLAYLDAEVIAIDIDPEMTQYIDTYKQKLPNKKGEKITTRLAEEDNPMLKDAEVDCAIIINTISYIDELEKYLTTLKPALKKDGRVVIVDYKRPSDEISTPPIEDMVSPLLLQKYLTNSGYTNVVIDNTSLQYQYIVTAMIP